MVLVGPHSLLVISSDILINISIYLIKDRIFILADLSL